MQNIKLIILLTITVSAQLLASNNNWFMDSINTPQNIAPRSAKDKIVIAIVDDGVRGTHKDIKDFIWQNPKETPANRLDDDGNGYVDDINGWDISDHDNNTAPPPDRLDTYYHGTHLAGIVTQIARSAYGNLAPDIISIMPVKCLADQAGKTYIKDGYKGIEYAVKANADIIICAWGVGHISPHESKILQQAHEKGILIVASAGTFPEEKDQYPAADENVLAVAALDRRDQKIEKTNYGLFVDLSAPGIDITSASSLSDTAYQIRQGSSMSAAIVAAAAAIIKTQHPSYSPQMITACLKNSAQNIEMINPGFNAKLGAGKLDIKAAIRSTLFEKNTEEQNLSLNPQGYLYYHNSKRKLAAWTIKPTGPFKGLRFKPVFIKGKPGKTIINFYTDDSPDSKLVASYPLSKLPESVYIPGTSAHITIQPKSANRKFQMLLQYKAQPIKFSELYCSGTMYLTEEGSFDDGSGQNDYSQNSDCKWLITAPQGKVIHFKFTEFDTEAKTDLLYFFNGKGTHEKIMAIFSGPNIPPELTTWQNQTLVWFVTDTKNQGKGFKSQYYFKDP